MPSSTTRTTVTGRAEEVGPPWRGRWGWARGRRGVSGRKRSWDGEEEEEEEEEEAAAAEEDEGEEEN